MAREKTLTSLANIGKTVAARLAEIGVTNANELKKMGSTKAYEKLSKKYPNQTLPVCYYLYSLEGAVQNKHWDDFTDAEKKKLRLKAGLKK